MKRIATLFALLLIVHTLSAQKTASNEFSIIDKKALQLPDSLTKTTGDIASYIVSSFVTEKDKSRAAFIWVASNIQYDIANMFAINVYEKEETKIARALMTRKGICETYAYLFTDICRKSGMKSVVIEGYTQQDGFPDFIPHVWCATRIDSAWYLFDPTWGSGYVMDNRFYHKINNNYHRTSPSKLIDSHMPFDYQWQFLNNPVTNQEFYEGKTKSAVIKQFFSFNDSILVYENLSHIEQLAASARRIEKNGVNNSMIFDKLQHIKIEIENEGTALYNEAVGDYNEGINTFNLFVNYRNRQFTPARPDPEIQQMLDLPIAKIKEARIKLNQVNTTNAHLTGMVSQLDMAITEMTTQLNGQQEWLKLYFSKKKSGRKSMFYKYTWFGIPLN